MSCGMQEVDYAISTGGYVDPLPLSRTSKGWEPTGARLDYWLLLGRYLDTIH